MEWFPHFVNTKIYRDYHEQKNIHLLMMGAVNDIYPLRKKYVTHIKKTLILFTISIRDISHLMNRKKPNILLAPITLRR